MSRFGADDFDENFPGEWMLWQTNFERHLKGSQGQAALLDLHRALLALPERRLISGRLADEKGCVCTVGALALHRRLGRLVLGDARGSVRAHPAVRRGADPPGAGMSKGATA